MTIKGIIDHFMNTYKVNISILSVGKLCLYNSYSQESKERLGKDLVELVEKIGGKKLPDYKRFLEIEISGEVTEPVGCDCIMPTIKYAFK
jgi:ubiquitin-activating enzyme E1